MQFADGTRSSSKNGEKAPAMACTPCCTKTGDEKHNEDKRGHWGNSFEFLFSVMGYAIGMASLWRFPYMVQRNGGGAFLVPYVVFVLLFGVPLFFLESALGQYYQRSPVKAFDICPLFKGVAFTMMAISIICTVYLVVVMAWSLYFVYSSFAVILPWTTCDNPWNTNSCLPLGVANYTQNASDVKPILSTEEFWVHNVLGLSTGVEDTGRIQPHLAISLLVVWSIIYICIFKGIESSRIAVYITVTAPFLLLLIFCCWTSTLPGAMDGVLVYITPRWEDVANYQVWLEAFIMVFYALGPAWGGITTLSSYNPFHQNCFRDTMIICVVDTTTAIFCGFVIFSGLGYMAHEAGVSVLDVVSSGPGLSFVTYPQVVASMPVPQLWSTLFFLIFFFLGIDTTFGMFKTLTVGLFDMYPATLATRKPLVTFILCVICFLAGLIFVTNGGMYYFQVCDWYIGVVMPLAVAFTECIIIGYIYGIERFLRNVREMLPSLYRWFQYFFKYSILISVPLVMAVALVFNLVSFLPPKLGSYTYPPWIQTFGWVYAAIGGIPIPVVMIRQLLKAKGNLKERFRQATQPTISRQGETTDAGQDAEETLLTFTGQSPLNESRA